MKYKKYIKQMEAIFRELDKKDCYLMLSNSDTTFIKDLYMGFKTHIVKANKEYHHLVIKEYLFN